MARYVAFKEVLRCRSQGNLEPRLGVAGSREQIEPAENAQRGNSDRVL